MLVLNSPQKRAPQWSCVEIRFTAAEAMENPYTDVECWVEFVHESGIRLRRPAFWRGGREWAVRFASPVAEGRWQWVSAATVADAGLHGRSGHFEAAPPAGETIFHRHGFWSIRRGERHLAHADGTSRFMVADTPWALPWRATPEEARIYAEDRATKGYNAALLMSVQPDMGAEGPEDRSADAGFAVGFRDLPRGTLRDLNPGYFNELDELVGILADSGIAPVWQPVFHGYGWKGQRVAGSVVSGEDYGRYCRYLVARYGAWPAMWLIQGDGGDGSAPGLEAGGQAVEEWDDYRQPTGFHYGPHALTDAFQDADWLDFQWSQTGHGNEHRPDRVAHMFYQQPVKAIANGEPTYENIGETGRAAGWWQGHEAWCNFTAGATMGVVYGAASLWNWVHHREEPGHADWCRAPGADWRDALAFPGSVYPGRMSAILDGLALHDLVPDPRPTHSVRALTRFGELAIIYRERGGSFPILAGEHPRSFRVFDPKTGAMLQEGVLPEGSRQPLPMDPGNEPRVVILSDPDAAA